MNKKSFKTMLVIIIFLTFILNQIYIPLSSESLNTRRILTPKDATIKEPWADLLTKILGEISGLSNFRIEPSLVAETFEALRQLRISPSEPAFRKLARHFLFQTGRITPEEYQINHLTFLIYEALQKYEFKECTNQNGTMVITYQQREMPQFATEAIEPSYFEWENELLTQQRDNPTSLEVYKELEKLYKEMIEKYPYNIRLWWQLSWVYGCLGESQERRIHFIEGAKQDIIPIPAHTSLYKIAQNVTPSVRERAIVNWRDYSRNDYLFLEEHALKYYLLFPEIFMPEEKPLTVKTEEFAQAVKKYDERAREILRAGSGIEIYAFVRKNIGFGEEPLRYLAYNPETLEVVGFRIMQDERGTYKIALDTFYKASKGMLEDLRKARLITLLINTQGEIAVAKDDHLDDAYRLARVEEQRTEFELFGLSDSMYQPALEKIEEKILRYPNKVAIIRIGGVSAAGKSPGAEIVEKYLLARGRTNVWKINMDNYFVDREDTPSIVDENGKEIAKDFEHPRAVNIAKFQEDLARLLAGETVEIPIFDFKSGRSIPHSGIKITLNPGDILIIEGIHALNPLIFTDEKGNPIIEESIFPTVKVAIDASPYIRLPRRVARDMQTRSPTPWGTMRSIEQWKYVRMGEDKYLYPTFENADVVINTDIPLEQFRESIAYEMFRQALTSAYQTLKKSPESFPGLREEIEEYFLLYFGEIP
ncbi:MAG: hypothetical protein NC818_03875 [Candidatus Omnitrophica bacterium]|nr:hypothetical protein [Candidatus Omnitrophota bacterium]